MQYSKHNGLKQTKQMMFKKNKTISHKREPEGNTGGTEAVQV